MKRKRWLVRLHRLSIQHRSALGLLLLIVASYVGNLARWTLFFNIDFVFGSIAVWLVMSLYGVRWGTLAGFVGGSCTYFLWHHPYAAIIFTCEALVVGWMFHRHRQNLVLLVSIFWLLIGMPLTWLSCAVIMQIDPGQAQIVLLKQPVNSIFNALITSLLITHLPIHRWLGRPRVVNTLSFQQTLFNLLVAFVFLPTLLLIILNSRDVVDNIKNSAQANLSLVSNYTTAEIRSWYWEHLHSTDEVARQMTDLNLGGFSHLQQHLESAQRLLPDFKSLTVFNADETTVLASTIDGDRPATAANQPYFQIAKATLQPIFSDVLPKSVPPAVIWNIPIIQNGKLQGLIVSEVTLDRINALLKRNAGEQQVQLTLVGRHHSVVASTQPDRPPGQPFNRRQNGNLNWLAPQTYQWFPTTGSPLPTMRWMNSLFVQESPAVAGLPWTLIVESSAKPDVLHIQSIYSRNLGIILVISVLALIFSALISRQLVRPLSKLATVTTNLPDKLLAGRPIDWIDSPVTEIAFLVQNFRTMSATLTEQFQEIQQALDYEALVKRITDKVRDSLDESQILQTAVQELGQGISVICCDAAIYNAEQTISTISYEYTTLLFSAQGQTFQIPDQFPGIHSVLLQGDHRQFCFLPSHLIRPIDKCTAIFACPIVDDQGVIGDLWLFKLRGKTFSNSEIRLVQQVANQCAIALRQAHLYQAAQTQVKALEELNRFKSSFIANVSHELRTPLTSVLGLSTVLLQKHFGPLNSKQEEYLALIHSSGDHLLNLINDLLDLAKIEAGKQDLNKVAVNLVELCQSAIEMVEFRAVERRQTITLRLPIAVEFMVVDPQRIVQILLNYLSNAVKFTPEGGMITLSSRLAFGLELARVALPVAATDSSSTRIGPDDCFLVLEVSDTGVGIPPERQHLLFQLFQQLDVASDFKYEGSGLGLSIAKHLAELHGGRVSFCSTLGSGSTFSVWLPV